MKEEPTTRGSGSTFKADPSLLIFWVKWFSIVMVTIGVALLILYGFKRSPASLIIACVMLFVFLPVTLWGYSAVRKGRASQALVSVGFCCWLLALLVATRGSTSLPASIPLILLPMIFSVPYVERKSLLKIALAAVVVCAIASSLAIGEPLLTSRLDETTLAIFMVPVISIASGLAVFGIWHVGSALRTSMREKDDMNARLSGSERELEQKVAARTGALEEAVSELSDINEIARAVNVTLELDEVITGMQSALQRVLPFDTLSVLLLDADRKRLTADHLAGIDLNDEDSQKLLKEGVPADEPESMVIAALHRKQPMLARSIGEEQLALMSPTDRRLHQLNPVRSVIIVPLEFAGKSIGLVMLGRRDREMDLSKEEVDRIQRYIAPLAIVIRNAHLLEAAQLAQAEAVESSRAKSQFLANMSHELRTPLNAIIGYSELLAEEVEDEGQGQYLGDLEKIRSSGHYLLDLIDGVLDLTRIEVGKLSVSISEFDVNGLLNDLIQTSTPLAMKKNNNLELDVQGELGMIHSDMTKLRQVLLNLLSNACKFTESGKIRLGASRERSKDGEWLIFSVEDNGIGMTEEHLARIFNAFTQADESTSRRYGGTGLGLTISREFCELLGGTLDVTSTEGLGSTFKARVPVQAPGAI